jgi:NAD(P) transhydrogenase subunit alpha
MIIAVPKETAAGERRVALVPDSITKLTKNGHVILVQRGAGAGAALPDALFEAAGARIVEIGELYSEAHALVRVARPSFDPEHGIDELTLLHPDMLVIGLLSPLGSAEYVQRLAATGVTAMSMDAIPRISRAQAMDALSSQSSVAGYKAVLMAAEALPRFFPMLTTAAGTIPPARVLVLGAGVAGLQAIATARRLGAVVSAYDVRAVAAEQVQSLGATFLALDLNEKGEGSGGYARQLSADAVTRQQAFLAGHAEKSDVIITTALIPGRPAPCLITRAAVEGMKPGSVIIDLAGETGGNCELSRPGEWVEENGVAIFAPLNVPSTMAFHASQLYARNVTALIDHLCRDGAAQYDFDDEITRDTCIAYSGRVTHGPTLDIVQAARS